MFERFTTRMLMQPALRNPSAKRARPNILKPATQSSFSRIDTRARPAKLQNDAGAREPRDSGACGHKSGTHPRSHPSIHPSILAPFASAFADPDRLATYATPRSCTPAARCGLGGHVMQALQEQQRSRSRTRALWQRIQILIFLLENPYAGCTLAGMAGRGLPCSLRPRLGWNTPTSRRARERARGTSSSTAHSIPINTLLIFPDHFFQSPTANWRCSCKLAVLQSAHTASLCERLSQFLRPRNATAPTDEWKTTECALALIFALHKWWKKLYATLRARLWGWFNFAGFFSDVSLWWKKWSERFSWN